MQRGIYYNPDNDFFAFDILVDNEEYKSEYNALEKHESKAINKFINKHANQLVNEYFEE